MSLGVSVLLGKTKVDDVHLVATLGQTHHEVVGLDIAVKVVFGMDILNTIDLQASNNESTGPMDMHKQVEYKGPWTRTHAG